MLPKRILPVVSNKTLREGTEALPYNVGIHYCTNIIGDIIPHRYILPNREPSQ